MWSMRRRLGAEQTDDSQAQRPANHCRQKEREEKERLAKTPLEKSAKKGALT